MLLNYTTYNVYFVPYGCHGNVRTQQASTDHISHVHVQLQTGINKLGRLCWIAFISNTFWLTYHVKVDSEAQSHYEVLVLHFAAIAGVELVGPRVKALHRCLEPGGLLGHAAGHGAARLLQCLEATAHHRPHGLVVVGLGKKEGGGTILFCSYIVHQIKNSFKLKCTCIIMHALI